MAGILIFSAGARGDGSLRTKNPYAMIFTRNVFGLQPMPVVSPPATTPPALPKITLNGTTSILGPREALFNVTEQSPSGQVTGNKSYLLKEGETQDGIEVTRVDEGTEVVFFYNHGTLQQIKLGATEDQSRTMSKGFHHPFD